MQQNDPRMEEYIVLAQVNVLFHGIWKTQYRVSESLIKSIGLSVASTQSRACKLVLTSAGLTLIVLPSSDSKRGRTDQVSFEALRDIGLNQYYPNCLMIVYVDDTNVINVMACSSKHQADIDFVAKSYRHRRHALQHQRTRSEPHTPLNSTLRGTQRFFSDGHQPIVKEAHSKSGISNSFPPGILTNGTLVSAENYGWSLRSDNSTSSRCFSVNSECADAEDVFIDSQPVVVHETEVLLREPVSRVGRPASFNTGIQTLPSEEDSDTQSVNSSSSIKAIKDDMHVLTEEMKAIKILLEKSTGISAVEYYKRRDVNNKRNAAEGQSLPKPKVSFEDSGEDLQEAITSNNDLHVLALEGENDGHYDLRSVGMQTLPTNNKAARRYAKKHMTASTSNPYKDKMATFRKRSASADKNLNSNGSGSAVSSPGGSPIIGSSGRSSTGSQHRCVTGAISAISQPIGRHISTGTTTVIRPIENVYQGTLARRLQNSKGPRVILFTPRGQNHI